MHYMTAIAVAASAAIGAFVYRHSALAKSMSLGSLIDGNVAIDLPSKRAEAALLSLNDAAQLWQELASADVNLHSTRASSGEYILQSACTRGMTQAVRAMLSHSSTKESGPAAGSSLGSRLNLQDAASGHTCLSLAAYHGHAQLIGTLGSAGRRVLSSLRTADGYTPLHLYLVGLSSPPTPYSTSTRGGEQETAVYTLIRLGSDVNAAVQVSQDTSPLHTLPEHVKMAEALLTCPDVHQSSLFMPTTALAMALHSTSSHHLVGPLLASGARASGASVDGVTPLMLALAYRAALKPLITDLLSRAGVAASVSSVRTVCGHTHLHVAAAAGVQVATLLALVNSVSDARDRSEFIHAQDTSGLTALDIARRGGHAHLVTALEDLTLAERTESVPPTALHSCPAWAASQRLMDAHPRALSPGPPPLVMPPDMVAAYTRCGSVEVGDMYVDDSRGGKGTHYKFGRKEMDRFMTSAQSMGRMPHPGALGPRGWLAAALRQFNSSVQGAKVVVFGSMQPLVETLVLAYGAASVTTVEYNRLTYDHPSVTTVTPWEVKGGEGRGQHYKAYDVALSISSFDHDGLGRYGDPLCPDCDLAAMDEVASFYLRAPSPSQGTGQGKQPLFFVTFPVGPDVVVWNLHRRYGRVRLPLMLHADNGPAWGVPASPISTHASSAGGPPSAPSAPVWHIQGAVGWKREHAREKLDTNVSWTKSYEPVWVLSPLAQ